jgi:TolA-binding protein
MGPLFNNPFKRGFMKFFLLLTMALFFFPLNLRADELSSVVTPVTAETKALFEKAKTLFDEKNYKDCKDILSSLVAEHPMDDFIPQARLILAKVQEDFDVSVAQLREVAEEYDDKPEGMEAQKELGDRFFLADKYEDAVDSYKEYLDHYEKSPMSVEVHYWLASSYAAAGKNEEAVKEFKQVMDKGRDTTWAPKALLGMGNTYFKMEKYSDAESRYLEILDKYALYDELNLVYLKLGETYELEKKWKQATAAYQTLINRYPKAIEVTEAQTRLNEIGKTHPELKLAVTVVPTPTAEAAATATAVSTPPFSFEKVTPTAVATIEEEAAATPEEAEQEETVDQPVLKPTPFHVQLGVYTQKSNVTKIEKAIRKAGYKYYVVTVKRDESAFTIYKVRVGHFATRSAAQKVAVILSKRTKEKAIVVEE